MSYQMRLSDQSVKKAHSPHQVPDEKLPNPYDANCPTRRLLDRIGDKWSVLALGLLAREPLRFNALRRRIEGVTQKMLSQTLKALERDGLVARKAIATVPVTVEYSISPLGLTLAETLERLQRWARDNIGAIEAAQRAYDEGRAGGA